MEIVRIEQLREILTLQVLPRLSEVSRRQTVLQATMWIGLACLLSGMVVILGLMGMLVAR